MASPDIDATRLPPLELPPELGLAPRPVVLWVGMEDSEVLKRRRRLPWRIQRMLVCLHEDMSHCVVPCKGAPIEIRRVRYQQNGIGFGIVIAEWETIAERPIIPECWTSRIGQARRALNGLGFDAFLYLTDQPA